ncbi:hypothetical protein NDU88_004451 [Pleurodeles waltl]|uniref:Uncharacterized protein n=1 Tax=Pleurodeles waltl TaxID=8319 RepID=A0AAV7T9S1_PLEWA|nr:hypothetical protein NDU88_004451 [Pleurodeles waltl]
MSEGPATRYTSLKGCDVDHCGVWRALSCWAAPCPQTLPQEPHDRIRPCHGMSDSSAAGARRLPQKQSTASPGAVFVTQGRARLKGRGQSPVGPAPGGPLVQCCGPYGRPATLSGRGPTAEGPPGPPPPSESSPGSLAPGPAPPLPVCKSSQNLQPCRRSSYVRYAAGTRSVDTHRRGTFTGAWLGQPSLQRHGFSGPRVVLQCAREPRWLCI